MIGHIGHAPCAVCNIGMMIAIIAFAMVIPMLIVSVKDFYLAWRERANLRK